jgi:hypothetical protein
MSEENKENLPVPAQPKPANVPVVNGVFAPNDLEGVWRLSTILAGSGIVPKEYRGKVEDTFVAISWGMEIGLSHNQSLHAIAVIDGKPSIYGDVGLALVRGSGKLDDIDEYFEGTFGHDDYKAVCKLKRKGEERIHESEFSIEDAKLMGKWNQPTKQGYPSVWMKHPKRMLKWRARWFALRDVFGDVLKGLGIYEEVRDSIDMEPDESGSYAMKEDSPKDDVSTPAETPENDENYNTGGEAIKEAIDEEIVESVKREAAEEPTDEDYVNPGEPDAVPDPVSEDVPIMDRFLNAMGHDLRDAAMKFVEKACEINDCPADEIYEDALARPDEFKSIIARWASNQPVEVREIKPPVEEAVAEPTGATENPNRDPIVLINSKAALHYNGALSEHTQRSLIAYIEYVSELSGLSAEQIYLGLNKAPAEWFQYFEDWCQTKIDEASEKATGEEGSSVKKPAPKETGTDGADLDNTGLIKPGELSWPSWKLKWNTMKPEDFKGFVWSQLDKFSAAETEAVAIAKRARAKWAKQWGDSVYPVDAKKQKDSDEQAKIESGDEDANSTIETRWAFVNENYPKETQKAMEARKFAHGGLTNGAKQMIIQDVFEACG